MYGLSFLIQFSSVKNWLCPQTYLILSFILLSLVYLNSFEKFVDSSCSHRKISVFATVMVLWQIKTLWHVSKWQSYIYFDRNVNFHIWTPFLLCECLPFLKNHLAFVLRFVYHFSFWIIWHLYISGSKLTRKAGIIFLNKEIQLNVRAFMVALGNYNFVMPPWSLNSY